MPTYEYRCDACKHQFELFQTMTASPIRICPRCQKRKVRRLLGPGGGLLFKGSGFYITDYRSSSYKDKAKSEKPSSAGASSEKGKSAPKKPMPHKPGP